jgi:hypothetical protein
MNQIIKICTKLLIIIECKIIKKGVIRFIWYDECKDCPLNKNCAESKDE